MAVAILDIVPCNVVEVYRPFGAIYCLHLPGRRINQAETGTLVACRLLGLLCDTEDVCSVFL